MWWPIKAIGNLIVKDGSSSSSAPSVGIPPWGPTSCDGKYAMAPQPVMNDEGAPVKLGSARGCTTLVYCGRGFEKDAVTGTQQCGPGSGPRCPSCRRFQATRKATPRLVQEMRGSTVRCSLRWRTVAGARADLDLSAFLVAAGGIYLGKVYGKLADDAPNIAQQFSDCGVTHLGAAPVGPGAREEIVELDLEALRQEDNLVAYIFIRAGLRLGAGRVADVTEATVHVLQGGRSEDFALDAAALAGDSGLITAVFLHDRQRGWLAAPLELPCSQADLREEHLQDCMASLAAVADALPTGAPQDEAELRQSLQQVAAYEAQEALVSKLVEGDCMGEDPSSSQRIERQLCRADLHSKEPALLRSAPAAPSAPSWPPHSASTAQFVSGEPPGMQDRTLPGLHEALSESGFQNVAAMKDTQAMKAFIRRVAVAHCGRNINESDLSVFAQYYSGERDTQSYMKLLSELHQASWATLPLGPISTAQAAAQEDAPAQVLDVAASGLHAGSDAGAGGAATAGRASCSSGAGSKATVGGFGSTGGERLQVPGPVPLSQRAIEPLPLEPCSGSVRGGTHLRWTGNSAAPWNLFIGGQSCAPLADGVFVAPLCRGVAGCGVWTVDVVAEAEDGSRILYPAAFTYWCPGELESIEPARGSITGLRLRVRTTDLGATISEVLLAGTACELGPASTCEATVQVPACPLEGCVAVEVRASNGNSARCEAAFTFYTPEAFGPVGDRVDLTDGGRRATRTEGVNGGVCLGAFPLRRFPAGRYFEVRVEEVCKGLSHIAVGVACRLPGDALVQGRIKAMEARELERVWLAGYDKGGGLFICDGEESRIPPRAWRPATHVKAGSCLGVLWVDAEPGTPVFVIFQDGQERVRLKAHGRLPLPDEELFAVIDLRGPARSVVLVEGATPPRPRTASPSEPRGLEPQDGSLPEQ